MGGWATGPPTTFCVPRECSPTGAEFSLSNGNAVVFFSCTLNGGGLEAFNWSGRELGRAVTWGAAIALTNRVLLIGKVDGGADPGPDVITYSPPPYDVVDAMTSDPIAAFANYPMSQAP